MPERQQKTITRLFQRPERWRLINEPVAEDPLEALQRDSNLLKEVAAGKRGATARLWENPQCLVVTRKETRFPEFTRASQALAEEGWPVIIRDSGGTTVPHHPGILNFSLIFPQLSAEPFDLDTIYMALCEPLRLALAKLGLNAEYGETPGSYCDGRYNLNVEGLKVTGTAQRLMVSPTHDKGISHGILAQAMLMVDADAQAGTDWVNRFYQLAGNDRRFDPLVSTSIKQLLEQKPDISQPEELDLTLHLRQLLASALSDLTNHDLFLKK